jgi:hypothetical protein
MLARYSLTQIQTIRTGRSSKWKGSKHMPRTLDLDTLTVTTTNGSLFTGEQSAKLAILVYKRFGCNMSAACKAWRRMLESNCPEADFAALISTGLRLDRTEKQELEAGF